ncbi:basic amino acid ABC transporter substrate-binding protein [Nocardioides seonyuensis]|uniref:Basic amino acid ABC transporter substrate-binding protein n=1 Tax=Nocardioides seonyuensis TaxID=2518371 RepID=A0A4P7ICW0_9ACTN|nr:basic amino acid ABC transporter substrate-binding protein [Nocardioides seonyuensis]QBX54383.1 basic amino acid ABC transporter substrate-binding protein [Nocardioides seonyuensis]
MDTRKLATAFSVAALALTAAGCATDSDKTETESGVEVVTDEKLTVCTHLPYEPFQYEEGGETVGFDVDLMDLVAEDLGLEQTIVNTPFETIETGQAMSTGQCDIAAAGMTITEARDEVIDFSDPYFNATQALLTKKGSGYDSLESLEGKTLGVQIGTTGQQYAEENAPEGVELKVFEDLALLLQAVKNGGVDAGINDNTVLIGYAEENPDTEMTVEFDTGEQYGFGVAQGEGAELLDAVNQALADAIEDGTYEELFTKYFPSLEVPTNLG